jgi:hypothetical protein
MKPLVRLDLTLLEWVQDTLCELAASKDNNSLLCCLIAVRWLSVNREAGTSSILSPLIDNLKP